MSKLQIRAGAQLTFEIEQANPESISATFIAKSENVVITNTVEYDADGIARFEFGAPDTNTAGTYDWQVNENFASGSPDKYPLLDNGDFPKLRIYSALDEEV